MKKLLIILYFLSYSISLLGQMPSKESIDTAKYKIIKTTVDFLATDIKAFGIHKPCSTCTNLNYEALKTYADTNKLTGVPVLIDEWRAVEIDVSNKNWKNDLIEFKNRIHDRVATGDREARKNLKNYKKYKAALDSIVNTIRIGQPVQKPKETPVVNNFPDEVKDRDNKSLDWWEKQVVPPYVLYITIVVLIALLALIFFRTKKVINGLDKEIRQYEKDNERLKANHQSDKNTIKSKLELAEDKISTLESELKAERKKNQAVNQAQVNQPSKQAISQVPKVETITKYARYADQGDGFTASDLLSESDSETIFEIVLTSPATAKYKIASNPAAQRYALSNAAYFLGKTCKYENAPSGQSNIYTDQQGELKLQGNKWLITNPAIISFR